MRKCEKETDIGEFFSVDIMKTSNSIIISSSFTDDNNHNESVISDSSFAFMCSWTWKIEWESKIMLLLFIRPSPNQTDLLLVENEEERVDARLVSIFLYYTGLELEM